MKPTIRANHLFNPMTSLRNKIERIVIKKGLTKNSVIALASESLVNEK